MKPQGTRREHFGEDVKRRETTRDERLRIITLRDDAQMKWKDIAARVDVDYRTCQKIYRRYLDSRRRIVPGVVASPIVGGGDGDDQGAPVTGPPPPPPPPRECPPSPSNKKRTGRPSFFTPQEKERLREFITRNEQARRMQYEEIIEALGYRCSVDTLRRTLRRMGFPPFSRDVGRPHVVVVPQATTSIDRRS